MGDGIRTRYVDAEGLDVLDYAFQSLKNRILLGNKIFGQHWYRMSHTLSVIRFDMSQSFDLLLRKVTFKS